MAGPILANIYYEDVDLEKYIDVFLGSRRRL